MTDARETTAKFVALFVDDEEMILRSIRRLLGDTCEVLTALSGEDALTVMRSRRVDILISDIDMPKMSGLELVQRAREEFPSTVRVLLTGAATLERVLVAINDGEVARFLSKPFDAVVFRETIGELGARILKARLENEIDGQRERREQLFAWVEKTFPGTTKFARGARSDLRIDVASVRAAVATGAPSLLSLLDES